MAQTATVGDPICGPDFLKGFNTYWDESNASITAATCGLVEIVERVVSCRGITRRYQAEVGDIVVVRITEVSGNRWRCDIGAESEAIMLLSNVTEPGGVLRRRGREDELSMRSLFVEGDIVVAEVQRIMQEGVISLHTRSVDKFGNVQSPGRLVSVNPSLIRRVKHHFHAFLNFGVYIVLGLNGRIWISAATAEQLAEERAKLAKEDAEADSKSTRSNEGVVFDPSTIRENCCRVRNCIIAMDSLRTAIDPESIEVAVTCTIDNQLSAPAILRPSSLTLLGDAIRDAAINRKRTRV
jgi:exosome complex component RRP4